MTLVVVLSSQSSANIWLILHRFVIESGYQFVQSSTCWSMSSSVLLSLIVIQTNQLAKAAPTQPIGSAYKAAIQKNKNRNQREKAFLNRIGIDSIPGAYMKDLGLTNQPFAMIAAKKRILGGGR